MCASAGEAGECAQLVGGDAEQSEDVLFLYMPTHFGWVGGFFAKIRGFWMDDVDLTPFVDSMGIFFIII
jgi:hypothetical protein